MSVDKDSKDYGVGFDDGYVMGVNDCAAVVQALLILFKGADGYESLRINDVVFGIQKVRGLVDVSAPDVVEYTRKKGLKPRKNERESVVSGESVDALSGLFGQGLADMLAGKKSVDEEEER